MKTRQDFFATLVAAALIGFPGAAASVFGQDSARSLLDQVSGCWGVEISGWSGERVPRDLVIPPFVRLDTTHAFPDDAESIGEQARRVLYPPRLEPDQYESTWILTALSDSVVMRWGAARGALSMSLGRELDALVGRAWFVSAELDADRIAHAQVRARRLNDGWCERQEVRIAEAAATAAVIAAETEAAEVERMEAIMAEVAEAESGAESGAGDERAGEAAAVAIPEAEAAPAQAAPEAEPSAPEIAAVQATPEEAPVAEAAPVAAAARPPRSGPITVRLAATVVARGTAALPANYDDIWDIRTAMADAIDAELDLDGSIDLYVPLEGIDPFNDAFHPRTDYVAEIILGYYEARDVLITETRIRPWGSDRVIHEWTGPGSIEDPSVIEDRVVAWITEHLRELP